MPTTISLYESTTEKNDLFGKVKQVRQTYFKVLKRYGEYVPGSQTNFINRMEICQFTRKGIIQEKHIYKVDDSYSRTIYNEDGFLETCVEYDPQKKVRIRTENAFNEEGKMSQSITYDAQNELELTSSFVYNQQGNLILYNSVKADGTIVNYTEYQWSLQGNKLEKKSWIDDKNTLLCWEKHEYDESGVHKGYHGLNEHGDIILWVKFFYDQNGECIGYSENGEIKPLDTTDDQHLDLKEFDGDENWIEAVYIGYNGKPEYIILREFTYYNDPSEHLILTDDYTQPFISQESEFFEEPGERIDLDVRDWKWILEGSTSEDEFDARRFYTTVNKHIPSRKEMPSYDVEVRTLRIKLMEDLGCVEIFTDKIQEVGFEVLYSQYVLYFPHNGYVLVAANFHHELSTNYVLTDLFEDSCINYVQFGSITLFFPSQGCSEADGDFEEELEFYMGLCRIEKKPEQPEIMMITTTMAGFALKSYPVQDNFEIEDLDLHYGNGFEDFHNELMNRFKTQHQGLILFHGQPGTGKTYYIRHLLRKMKTLNKVVIYMPPNMVDHMVDPEFMTFITHHINSFATKGLKCVLLIEDAEPLLVARDEDTRIQGITNLLNMTDGLLNDMLKIQIICTFNVNLKQLDKALLRPGRLTARKEFTALPAWEANILAHQLGIKYVFDQPATLAEIYAKVIDKDTLMHNE